MKRPNVLPALSWLVRSICLLAATMFWSVNAAADVNVAWDPVSNATGYYLHYGASAGNYTSRIDVGNVTAFTVTGLTEGAGYHFAATAYDAGGESSFSNDAAATNPYAVPVAAFTASATSGMAPLAMNMVDGSTGRILTYAWTFGDGTTSTSPNPSHVYSSAGVYTVGLTVTGPGGSDTVTRANYITVAAPTAAVAAQFTSDVTTGLGPLDVQFTSTSTGTIVTYMWSFGDGTTSALANPAHTYVAPGRYTVALTVTGASGNDMITKTRYIDVKRRAP